MDTWEVVLVVAAVVLVAAAIAFVVWRERRSRRLREQFGDEYDRTVHEHGDRRSAEAELEERIDIREQLDIRPLSFSDRERYAGTWEHVQSRFVDEPRAALLDADFLVGQVMQARGYPTGDFDDQLVSVDHPDVVANYRKGHRICLRCRAGEATTDELREGLLAYRSLFDELLGPDHAEEHHDMRRTR